MGDRDPRAGRDAVPDDQGDTPQIRMHAQAGAVVLALRGAIDDAATVGLRYAVNMALQAPSGTPVVVDLTAVTRFGAAALQTLADAHGDAGGERQPVRLVVDRARPVVGPTEVTEFSRELALYHDLDDALHARRADRPSDFRAVPPPRRPG